jgi:hypothetical protein
VAGCNACQGFFPHCAGIRFCRYACDKLNEEGAN